MSEYRVDSPGFLDLPASKTVKKPTSKTVKQSTGDAASKPAKKPKAVSDERRRQLSLTGFDKDLHRELKVAAGREDTTMVRLLEGIVSDWLERSR